MSLDTGLATHALGELHESDDNPRTISDERFDALKYALKADPSMLQARPIIALPSGEVVAGNMRLRALIDLGWTEAPVFVADLDAKQKREWMLRDNQEYGDWVPDDLGALIAAHREDGGDLKMLGFAEPQMEALLKSHDGDANGDGSITPQGGTMTEVWGIVVDCDTEDQQTELLDELAERGLEVRALIP